MYLLVELSLSANGDVVRKNLGVTFNVYEAEAHAAKGFENEYETLSVDVDWQEEAARSELTLAMRTMRDMVEEMQKEALR